MGLENNIGSEFTTLDGIRDIQKAAVSGVIKLASEITNKKNNLVNSQVDVGRLLMGGKPMIQKQLKKHLKELRLVTLS